MGRPFLAGARLVRKPLKNDKRNKMGGNGGRRGGARAGGRGCKADPRPERVEAGGRGLPGAGSRAARVPCSCRGRAGRLAGGRRRARSGAASRLRDGLNKGHGRLSGPRRRWRRRGSARLRPVGLRLRLRTRDQNSLGGADAAAAGFSGKAARAAPGLTPLAAARDGGGSSRRGPGRAGPDAAAAPHSVPGLRRRRLVAFLGLEDWPSLRRRESGPSEIRLRGRETCADQSPAAGAPPGLRTRIARGCDSGGPRPCSRGAEGTSAGAPLALRGPPRCRHTFASPVPTRTVAGLAGACLRVQRALSPRPLSLPRIVCKSAPQSPIYPGPPFPLTCLLTLIGFCSASKW